MNYFAVSVASVYLWATLCLIAQLALAGTFEYDAVMTFLVSFPFAASVGSVLVQRRIASIKA